MGMRFKKSIKVAPGVKVNIGKKSAGVSIGGKYGGMSFNTKNGTRARISAPGTGMSYSTKIGKKQKKPHTNQNTANKSDYEQFKQDAKYMNSLSKEEQYKEIVTKNGLTEKSAQTYRTVFLIIAIICFLIGIPTLAIGIGVVAIIIGFILLYYAHLYKNIVITCFKNNK